MQIGTTLGVMAAGVKDSGSSSKKIADAAKQFESILINQMLQSARASSEDSDAQDSAISDYSQQQFAQALAERGGIGIAKMVVAGLKEHAN